MAVHHKTLTDADLGVSITSHQTHIGLLNDMVRSYQKADRIIDALFYTPELGAEVRCKGVLNAIQRENGAIEAPKLKSGGHDAVTIDGVRNLFMLIRQYATSGAKPRELWVEERLDGTFRVQVLPATSTEMYWPTTK